VGFIEDGNDGRKLHGNEVTLNSILAFDLEKARWKIR
jgi:hypothetical protein